MSDYDQEEFNIKIHVLWVHDNFPLKFTSEKIDATLNLFKKFTNREPIELLKKFILRGQ